MGLGPGEQGVQGSLIIHTFRGKTLCENFTVSFWGRACRVQSTSTLCERKALYESCSFEKDNTKYNTNVER